MNTNNLSALFELAGMDVQGRSNMEPGPQHQHLLQRFAKGDCTQSERSLVCTLLRTRPELQTYLAELVKKIRGPQATMEEAE